MATVIISAGQAGAGQASIPSIFYAVPRASQTITSGAGNTVSTVAGKIGESVVISASGNAVKIAATVGANPDATASAAHICPDGGSVALYCQADDTRFAVADV